MPVPILFTKLYIPPPRPKIVLRSRLIERLNESLDYKLTLISAPAGFGKTTLVSEWIAGCKRPVAWLSLDEGDNDLSRFLIYLITALQTLPPNTGGTNIGAGMLAILQAPQLPPIESILTSLLNDITTISDNFILVLDDYHVIDSKPIDRALAFLLEHLPPQMHLVITSREDPSLPLARLRARGQLTELRLTDLRFTSSESTEFLNQVMGLNLSADDSRALETRTEGWIAGLQLAALSMQGHQDTAGFIQAFTGSHHYVLDYLLEEVLQRQPEHIQTFLLRTSILNRMCASLCEIVLEDRYPSAQETLEQLERANLFIVPLDNERRWYRYHHLFGDILRLRLGKPPDLPELHLRASQWLERNGDTAEAFQHAIAAADYGRAAGLAESAWQGMEDRFQTAAWLGWMKKLPEDVVRVRPVLSTQMGWAFMDAGDPEASELHLQEAERCLAGYDVANELPLKPLPAMIAMARAYNAQVQGDLATTVKYATQALQIIPEDDLFRRAQATMMLEFTHWASGDLESARSALGDWMNSMEKAGNFTFVVASAFAVADILVEQGHLREAEKTYRQFIQLAAEHGKEAQQVTAHHHLGLAMLHHEMGKDAAFAEELEKARELGEQSTLVDWPYRWHIAQARLKESGGDLEEALVQLDKAMRVYVMNPVPDTHPVEALKAKVYLKQGRLSQAQGWVHGRGLSADDEISYLTEFEHLTLARVLMAGNAFMGVNGLLERLLALAETQRRTGSVIEIRLIQALVYQAQGNRPQALDALEHALALTEPEGYLRIFVDEGEAMRLLLWHFKSTNEKPAGHPLRGYVDNILAAFSHLEEISSKSTITKQASEIIEPLTDRELEILRLISQGHSNAKISQRLYLALSTVKGHNLRIFNKLQAQNRTEAVARARELGLL